MNVVALDGYCITEPDIKQAGDTRVARFRLAVKFAGPRKTGDSKGREDGIWSVEAWGKQADFVEKNIKKGNGVTVSGSLQLDKWEKDGVTRESTIINANQVGFPPRGGDKAADGSGGASEGSGGGGGGGKSTEKEYDPYDV